MELAVSVSQTAFVCETVIFENIYVNQYGLGETVRDYK